MTTWPKISPIRRALETWVETAEVYSFLYSLRKRTLIIVLAGGIRYGVSIESNRLWIWQDIHQVVLVSIADEGKASADLRASYQSCAL